MIVPLFFEQFLLMLVGLADTFFISQAGEAAVAGVSLTNQFNTVFIFLFTALAAGGAVVVSQYVGTGDADRASEAASQLLMFSIVFSVAMSVVVLLLRRQLLGLMFGRVEPAVMDACVIYLGISALSYPALAVYNAGAATFRSIGKTSVTMVVSIISNAVNVVGNYIGKAGMSAVSIGGDLLHLLTFVAMGFSSAGQVIIARDVGAGRRDDVKKTIGTMFSFLLAASLAIALVCFGLRHSVLRWLNTPAASWQYTMDYMVTCICGLMFIYGYNIVSAILRGMGDSKRPFVFIAIGMPRASSRRNAGPSMRKLASLKSKPKLTRWRTR